ncbi:hypothetical protein V5799_024150 [Amblyomma americanum]|uniref:ATP-dependent DNA helicase n=1 Tax=Amblyomma americanum TaxID=6943 RepID=A0AAQ4ECV1_AMBAM
MIIEEVIHRLTTEDSEPLRIFFTGPAGCGKTFTLHLIMDVYNRYCKSKKIAYGDAEISGVNAYVACATTGKAAVALNGVTVHSAFKMVMSNTREDKGLSAADLNTFRTLLKGVRCVIIDEVSMLSSDLLRQVDRRLRQIRADRMREPFGAFDVILCGDMRQLPPVRASEVYKRPKSNGAVFSTEVMAWHTLEYFPLTQVVRQSDVVFSNLLTKIGDGAVLEDFDVELLESRFVDAEEAGSRSEAVRLYYSNADVDAYNDKIAKRSQDKVDHPARDFITGYRSQDEKDAAARALETSGRVETGNLPGTIALCAEKPYMLLKNIDITDGLVNGMVGKLKLIEYDAQGEPCRVWLRCPPGVGILAKAKLAQRGYRRNMNAWIPIDLMSMQFQLKGKLLKHMSVKRTQFPLVPASAMTIHKSQGGTFDAVVYEYAANHPQKLVYVALSRATSLEGLYLTNKDGCHKFTHKGPNPDRALKAEFERSQQHPLETAFSRCERLVEKSAVTIATLNVRSLLLHNCEITSDAMLMSAHALVFTETGADKDTPETIKGFTLVGAAKRPDQTRNAEVAIYVRDPLRAKVVTPAVPMQRGEALCVEIPALDLVVSGVYVAPQTSNQDAINIMADGLPPRTDKRIQAPEALCGGKQNSQTLLVSLSCFPSHLKRGPQGNAIKFERFEVTTGQVPANRPAETLS